jgi:beta-mannosidase
MVGNPEINDSKLKLMVGKLVWHGTQEKHQIFETLGGRFNSEFGMEAFPNIQTIEAFVTKKSQMYPQSHTLDFHNKADGHERRIATYMVENFRIATELEVCFPSSPDGRC